MHVFFMFHLVLFTKHFDVIIMFSKYFFFEYFCHLFNSNKMISFRSLKIDSYFPLLSNLFWIIEPSSTQTKKKLCLSIPIIRSKLIFGSDISLKKNLELDHYLPNDLYCIHTWVIAAGHKILQGRNGAWYWKCFTRRWYISFTSLNLVGPICIRENVVLGTRC